MDRVNTALSGQSTNTVADRPNDHSPHWTDRTQFSLFQVNLVVKIDPVVTAVSGPSEHCGQRTKRALLSVARMDTVDNRLNEERSQRTK